MALGATLLIVVLVVAGAVATLVQAASVVERGVSRTSAAVFATGWLLLVFIPVAWGIFGGQTAWYVQAVGAYDFAGAIPFHIGGGIGALSVVLFMRRRGGWKPLRFSALRVALALSGVCVLWIAWLTAMELDL